MVLPTTNSACSSDGAPLCALAKKVPAPKRTGIPHADDVARRQRDALIWIIDRLSKRPEQIIPLQSYLITGDFALDTATGAPTSWTGNYKQLERLPKQFMTKLLLNVAAEGGTKSFSCKTAAALEKADATNIPTLFSMVLQLPLSLTCPEEFADESICMRTLIARAKQVGDRLAHFGKAGGFLVPGKLDMKAGGTYALTFDNDGRATTLTHCSGANVTIPRHVHLDATFALHDNHLEFKTAIKLHPTSILLHTFFETADPRPVFLQHMYTPGKKWRGLQDSATKLADEMARLQAGGVAQQVAESAAAAMQEAGKVRRTETLKKARAALEERQEKRKQARIIKLS